MWEERTEDREEADGATAELAGSVVREDDGPWSRIVLEATFRKLEADESGGALVPSVTLATPEETGEDASL